MGYLATTGVGSMATTTSGRAAIALAQEGVGLPTGLATSVVSNYK